MKGQTLIEVLIALGIAVVVVSAVTVTSISSLSSAQYIRDQDQASKYAQEGIENMRSIRNSSYLGFQAYSGVYCLDSEQTELSSPVGTCSTVNIDNTFIRSVQIQQDACATNVAKVTVNVAYTSGKCSAGTYCHSSKLVSCFSTVDPVSGP